MWELLMDPTPKTKLADPQGRIGNVRAKLNPKCAVYLSPFRDVIIQMRLQGVDYRGIEDWLLKQGDQFRIPASTLHRNLSRTAMQANLTYAEEVLEGLGGQVEVDLVREMSANVWLQKRRLDRMVRAEDAKQAQGSYGDRRIRQELAVYNDLLKTLHTVLQEAPVKAREAQEAEQKLLDNSTMTITDDAREVLKDLLLNNEISFGPAEQVLPARSKLTH